MILPRIETERTRDITRFGSLFHQIAEHNFDKTKISSMLFADKLSVRKELEQYAERVKERFYFKLPAVNEQFLKVEIEPGFILRGVPDRVCYSENVIYIVDYKTAAIPDPAKDKLQGIAYIYLLSRLEGTDVNKIELVLDYVKTEELYQFKTTSKEMKEFESYLKNSFVQASILREAYTTHGQIRKIPHTVGECTFCSMAGKCLAYQSAVNPVPEPFNIKVETSSLGTELATVEHMKKIYEERSKALKDALMLRHDSGDESVKDYCSVVESKTTVYPSESVLNRILPELIRDAVKLEKYRFLLDISHLTENLLNSIVSILPDTLSPQSIPEGLISSVIDLKMTQPRAKYLKIRKPRK
jgi:hypothetical protein